MDPNFGQDSVDSPAPRGTHWAHSKVLIWQWNWPDGFKMASLRHLGLGRDGWKFGLRWAPFPFLVISEPLHMDSPTE